MKRKKKHFEYRYSTKPGNTHRLMKKQLNVRSKSTPYPGLMHWLFKDFWFNFIFGLTCFVELQPGPRSHPVPEGVLRYCHMAPILDELDRQAKVKQEEKKKKLKKN